MPELLVISPSTLGDIAHTLRVVASLRAQQPDWSVSLIVRDLFAPLVRPCTAVDHVYLFQRQGGTRGFLRLMREVRRKEFAAALDFEGLLRAGLMMKWCRAKRKIGRSDAREGARLFYTEKIPLPPTGEVAHPLEILLQFCVPLGAQPELPPAPLHFRAMERLNLSFMDPRCSLRPVLIFPGSRREERRWNGFAQFSALLARDSGRKIVWAGSDYQPCREVFPEGAFLNLTGNTSLTSLASLIAKSEWVISNDSGPMHLAAALGVKTLGLFGPSDARRHGPYPLNNTTNFVIQAPVGDLRLLTAKDAFARFKSIEEMSLVKTR
jgi:heptosyltransferase-1